MNLSKLILEQDCGCDKISNKKIILKEGVQNISEGLRYHIDNQVSLHENIYRPASDFYFSLFKEARELLKEGLLEVGDIDKEMLETTDIGNYGHYKGIKVPLDFPLTREAVISIKEAKYHGKEVQLGKVHRGGSRKFYVFVKNPKTGNVKKISFGDTTGLRIKIKNPKARKAFAARHKCSQANDRLSRRYWACRLPRYLPGSSFSGFW